MGDAVLVLGSGGREHTLAWKLAQSADIRHVFVAPGNAATHQDNKISNTVLDVSSHADVISWCKDNSIKCVVVGPEAPLADGISDSLNSNGIPCFGPSAVAAEIESSKAFAKDFMKKWQVPTARYQTFTDYEAAEKHIKSASYAALVVKASGLAAGKGVIVANDVTEACSAARDILQTGKFGAAGSTVVVEELLEGEEVSCLAFTDGVTVRMMPPAQDHKRLLEGDQGPNTGGMGAYCPCPLVSAEDLEIIRRDVLQKTVDGLKQDGRSYQGVLYAGLMLTKDGPKCLEFNCRFGDPETQVLLPLMKSDLYAVVKGCISGQLHTITPEYHSNQHAVAVVTVAKGYPEKYNKGMEISGLDAVKNLGHMVFHAGTKMSGDTVVSNGGRVLAVVAMAASLAEAARNAQQGAALIEYEGKVFRMDIAHKALKSSKLTYSDSGVSIEAGDALVEDIKRLVAPTLRAGCASSLGLFGAAFDLKKEGYVDPILVSGTDGVGTKLKIAQQCGIHDTVGIDLVAMCVNDVLCHGAEPLYFLDYFACGQLDVGVAAKVVSGVAKGCQIAGCALTGGETAEMPGMYRAGEYDLAGFTVGAIERDDYLPQISAICPGDHVIGLASSGLHSNGFSLVRKVIETSGLSLNDPCPFDSDQSLGQALLTPTEIYVKPILSVNKTFKVKAIAHVTGGGLPGNVSRILPHDVSVKIDADCWNIPPVFTWLFKQGNIDVSEMQKTFNCGIGLVLVVDRLDRPEAVCHKLSTLGVSSWHIGSTHTSMPGHEQVEIKNLEAALNKPFSAQTSVALPTVTSNSSLCNGSAPRLRKRVAVLISGSGTNMKALLDDTLDESNQASSRIVLVISNKPDVKGLLLAQQAGVQTKVISHKDYDSREKFDAALHNALTEAQIDIVCLAGFMRILTGGFVRKWSGRMLNVHPALLPSFKGYKAQEQAIQARVTISGCTVHFVVEEVDAGAILVQESVPVYPDDTTDRLTERIKRKEHTAFPRALELVSSGRATLGPTGHIIWC